MNKYVKICNITYHKWAKLKRLCQNDSFSFFWYYLWADALVQARDLAMLRFSVCSLNSETTPHCRGHFVFCDLSLKFRHWGHTNPYRLVYFSPPHGSTEVLFISLTMSTPSGHPNVGSPQSEKFKYKQF